MDFTGKRVLISGASRGIGRACAHLFAQHGATIAVHYHHNRAAADETLSLLPGSGHVIVQGDIADPDAVARIVEETARTLGGIDVLVNNAGIGITGPVEVQDMEATRLIFDTNVFGPQRVARAALPAMRKKKSGLIFNISSQLGRVIVPGGGHYSATKFALEAMSEQMAYELVPLGIEVCIIQPGGYPTRVWINRNGYTKALRERTEPGRLADYPALTGRMGTEDGSGRTADPADVPKAMLEIAGLPAGKRPLRRAVHPGAKPQEAINRVSAETQVAWLGNSPFGPWIKAVHD